MSAISSAIPSATNASATGSSAAPANGFDSLSSQEFLRIMFSELANQDPLKPNDTQAVLDQISSIRSIESDLNLSDKLESLVSQNQLASAGTLIGKFVSGLSDSGGRAGDLVLSVSSTKNGAVLNLASGDRINMSRVEEIIDPNLISTIDSASNTGTTTGANSADAPTT